MTDRPLFTRNQREVLGLVVEGKRTCEVAAALNLDWSSVHGTIARARQRVGARSNMQLVAIAVTSGEVRPPRLLMKRAKERSPPG